MAQTGQRYVSSELAHFVGRGREEEQQYQLLLKILHDGWLTASPHTPNVRGFLSIQKAPFSSNKMFNPQCVCFCDIPIADLGIHVAKYSRFGLSFSKDFIVQKGGCPVFYLPKQASVRVIKESSISVPEDTSELSIQEFRKLLQEKRDENLFEIIDKAQYFDKMIEEYRSLTSLFDSLIEKTKQSPGVPKDSIRLQQLTHFIYRDLLSFIKFFDHLLPDDHPDNYYMEREWRVIDQVQFNLTDVKTVFMPKEYSKNFREGFPSYESQLVLV